VLAIANDDLPTIEERFKRLRNDVSMLQFQRRIDERNLYQLNNQIATTTKLLNSFRMSCKRERREIGNLYNKKTRLEAIVTGFKSNNEEYLKINKTVEEKVSSVLTDGKVLLQFVLASLIEAIRRNLDKYNYLLSYNVPSSGPLSYIESYNNMILDESNRLYDRLLKFLTNSIMDNVAGTSSKSSLSSTLPRLSNQSDTHRTADPEIYHSKGDIAD
jgi:hypothetical protein